MTKKYAITALAYDKRGRLLSVGKNNYHKTHVQQAKYSKRVGNPLAIYLHAELDALLKAKQPVYKLIVTRFDSKGNPRMAKPCPACQLAIKEFGVKEIEYTIDNDCDASYNDKKHGSYHVHNHCSQY
jgi:deoxycytidylate deaminase